MDAVSNSAVSSAEAEGEALHPGEIVQGKYLIQRIVGVGGMCVVGAATNVALEQIVALKVLRRALAQNNEMVVRFMREARSAARLKSEHVARVFDVSVLDTGEPFMVMEYLEGKDLGVMLDMHGALPLPEAVEYVLQACEALGEAHSNGLVHRDIKPENLFLTRRADGEPHVKVLDFGIAKAIQPTDPGIANSGLTQDNATFGTPTYMSPEQLREARDVDARSDIFSLGVLLYELTSGRLPFEGNSTAELHAAILMEEPPALHELDGTIPEEFDAVVTKALSKDRFERYQNVAELAQALIPFAPARARQYADRVARVVSARPMMLSSADIADVPAEGRASPTPGSGRQRRVALSPVPPSGVIRLTPTSDPVRLSLTGSAKDVLGSGELERAQSTTLAPPKPDGSKRTLWIALVGGVALLIGVLAAIAFAFGPSRQAPAAAASATPAETVAASAPAVPSAAPSAAPEVQATASASAPVASATAVPTAPTLTRTPSTAVPAKTSKPNKPAAKTDDFDPFGKRK